MVITMLWMESSTVMIISLCVLTTIGVILLCCICWERRKHSFHHFYILDENGLRQVAATEMGNENLSEEANTQKERNMFKHLPSTDSFKSNFTSKMLPNNERKKFNSECDLIQSMEITDTFDHSVLRLETNDNNNLVTTGTNQEREEDVKSCISDDSKYTFYSTYHMARTISAADTIRSALSQSDLNKCVV